MDSHEIKKRQHRRAVEAQKRQEIKKKRRRTLFFVIFIIIVLALLCLCISLLFSDSGSDSPSPNDPTTASNEATAVTEATTSIELAFGGDINITNRVVEAGFTPEGYDYSNIFMDILPDLASADNTVVNFEGSLCGPPYGTENAKAPQELADELARSGVDMLQIANSYTINNGMIGLNDTLSNIRRAGMEPLGAYATQEEAQQSGGFVLRDIRGIKVAFVAFTKGMDGMSLPVGKDRCVNLLYKDYTSAYQTVDTEGITQVLDSIAAANPDITIATLHWGSEYNNQISSSQKKIVELMQEKGVDAIIGTHSHYVQQIDFNPNTGALIAYSLGDLLGNADTSRTAYSIILKLTITKNNGTGQALITNFDYTPIYIDHRADEGGEPVTRLLRIRNAIEEYEANGMNRVSDETYAAMKTALSKLETILSPKEE